MRIQFRETCIQCSCKRTRRRLPRRSQYDLLETKGSTRLSPVDHIETCFLRWENRTGTRTGPRVPGMEIPWNPDTHLLWTQITQIYSSRLNFFVSPCPESPCHTGYLPVCNPRIFLEVKLWEKVKPEMS